MIIVILVLVYSVIHRNKKYFISWVCVITTHIVHFRLLFWDKKYIYIKYHLYL